MRFERAILWEMVRAFCVLALIFLNFGHAPLALPPGGAELVSVYPAGVAAAPELCAMADNTGSSDDHAPCHACRIGAGLDLPGAPCQAETLRFVASAVGFSVPAAPPVLSSQLSPAAARAPPVA